MNDRRADLSNTDADSLEADRSNESGAGAREMSRTRQVASSSLKSAALLSVIWFFSWLGAYTYPSVMRTAQWIRHEGMQTAGLEWPAAVLARLVTILGEPVIFVFAFLILEAVVGLKPCLDRKEFIVWSCLCALYVLDHFVFLPLTILLSSWVPVDQVDMAVFFPEQRSPVLLNSVNFLLYVVLLDFGLYWIHRLSHHFGFLWRFHAVHHSYENLNSLHSLFHPVDIFVRLVVIQYPLMVLINYNEGRVLWVIVGFYFIHDRLVHTNAPLGFGWFSRLICDNRLHFIHHSRNPEHQRRNYAALFPVFDMLYGTYCGPQALELNKTGLEGVCEPDSLWAYLTATLSPRDPSDIIPVDRDNSQFGSR